jgi:cytochrome c-type biogenesis protein CcmH
MNGLNLYYRGAEAQTIYREERLSRLSLRRLGALVSLCWILLFSLFAGLALAREAAPLAPDEATERRLIDISSELRCLVCQNESLAASNAELAYDLRREIRAMIRAGKSDSEIMDFMVGRYGDFVRYRPPLKAVTLLLWFGPGLLFVGGLATLIVYLRRRNKAISDAPLTALEQARADRLLKAGETPQ